MQELRKVMEPAILEGATPQRRSLEGWTQAPVPVETQVSPTEEPTKELAPTEVSTKEAAPTEEPTKELAPAEICMEEATPTKEMAPAVASMEEAAPTEEPNEELAAPMAMASRPIEEPDFPCAAGGERKGGGTP